MLFHTVCLICDKPFERQDWNVSAKYCSYECKNKSQSGNILTINCSNCGKPFIRKECRTKNSLKQFCCRECLYEYNKGSNHYEWKESLHNKNIKLALKQWGQKIKNRDNNICQLCGETNKELLEAHHIIPKYLNSTLIFDFNNGITLCLECHYKQHINDINASRLIKYKIDKIKNNEKSTKRFKEITF